MIRIVLPWPDKALSPNAHLHWAPKSLAKKKARTDACYATYEAINGGLREARQAFAGTASIPLTVTFYPPDNRRRDDDNMVGSFKASRDGIADALGVDDRRFRPHYFFEDAAKPGWIAVCFPQGAIERLPSLSGDASVAGMSPDEQEAA